MGMQAKGRRSDFEAGRQRFLDAADRVYIREGYEGATIRAITTEAGTSLARLNRHWSSKAHLFEEVFARHFDAIHKAQHARLDRLDEKGDTSPAKARRIFEAFLSPGLVGVGLGDENVGHLVYCRAMTDPSPEVQRIAELLVAPIRKRLVLLLKSALRHLDDEKMFFALTTIFGAYVYPQIFGRGLALSMGIDISKINWKRAGFSIAKLMDRGLGHG